MCKEINNLPQKYVNGWNFTWLDITEVWDTKCCVGMRSTAIVQMQSSAICHLSWALQGAMLNLGSPREDIILTCQLNALRKIVPHCEGTLPEKGCFDSVGLLWFRVSKLYTIVTHNTV